MAFRKKAGLILAYQPDIIVVPECEHPDKIKFDPALPQPSGQLWFGDNPHKGLGIFAYNGYQLKKGRNHQKDLKLIAPVIVTRDDKKFNLFAIWANNPDDPDGQYVEQDWQSLTCSFTTGQKRNTQLLPFSSKSGTW